MDVLTREDSNDRAHLTWRGRLASSNPSHALRMHQQGSSAKQSRNPRVGRRSAKIPAVRQVLDGFVRERQQGKEDDSWSSRDKLLQKHEMHLLAILWQQDASSSGSSSSRSLRKAPSQRFSANAR
jgi:hypothetical protein